MRFRFFKSGLIFFIILLIIILHYSRLLLPVENLLLKFLNPLGGGIYRFSQKVQLLWQPDILRADYEKLEEERNQLLAKNVELQTLEEENAELRSVLNFTKENRYDFQVADVIGRDPVSSNYFILNKGTRDGIKVNFPVVSSDGVLVGKIIKAEEKISVMIIPTDAGFQTAAFVLDKAKRNTSGLVKGEKGLSVKMEFIPQDEEIEQGDMVITSGLELNMPKGLLIGKISEIQKGTREVFSEAVISPLISYDNLNIVMVLLSSS